MHGEARRSELRPTFDGAPEPPDGARPRYPEALFDTDVRHSEMCAGDHVLVIGPTTGIATEPMVARGLMVTSVKLGEARVAVARSSPSRALAIVALDRTCSVRATTDRTSVNQGNQPTKERAR